ncbi:MAG: hypothetical protein A2071_06660, partial [Bacteroidetes bacterium GWC1_47_7]
KSYRLYEADSTSLISFHAKQWGFYEVVSVSSHNGSFSTTRLLGKKQECDHKAVLWLCDRNRALSLSGKTEISGKIFIPLNGINYTEIDGEYYQGDEIPYAQLGVADAELPPIDSNNLIFLADLKENRIMAVDSPATTDTYYGFNKTTSFFNLTESKGDIILRGNVVLYADELTISASSKINEVIIFARKVTIEEGFTGSMQIFCSDTVLINEHVTLQYPSGIFVDAEIDRPYVSLSDHSEINGYVIIKGKIRDEELLFPAYRQSEKSLLRGLLYVDGTTNIRGELSGAVYLKDCFFTSNQNVYAGALYNTRILRNDNIAYPIFLSGEYTRKEIKSIY